MIKLYDHNLSGNCFKVRLLLTQAQIEFESAVVDVFTGENKLDKYLKINPAAKIPCIDDNGLLVWESNAILLYLSEAYPKGYLPDDINSRANIYKWLFFNKTSVDPYLAKARAMLKFYPNGSENLDELNFLQNEGNKSLAIIDNYLKDRTFFDDKYSIADIAFYPYIKLSYEGDILLDKYKNIINWINKVESTKNFIEIY